MKRTVLYSALVALLVSLVSFFVLHHMQADKQTAYTIQPTESGAVQGAMFTMNDSGEIVPLDFTKIAERVVDAVVHIKSTQTVSSRNRNDAILPDPFREFFGEQSPFFRGPQQTPRGPQLRSGTGSGVIINEGGYIVTNNHVIEGADDIEVSLHDNRTFKATVVGTDPTTDLALLQIKASGLPTLPLVNSDQSKVGEWVLAVGNPMGLNSTVTAGIISAKGRSINILREEFAIESFIQTDAAINPGNSGGALVNLEGGLIGINTAIASTTGSYTGYGFAVPSNIVNKVVEDLLQYGVVQKGVLGVRIRSVNGGLAKEKDLKVNSGAFVDTLLANSSAEAAGVRVGDVIVKVDGKSVSTSATLQQAIAQYRPGDTVVLTINRNGKEKEISVVLNNRSGNTDLVEKEQLAISTILGADLEDVDETTLRKLELEGGVRVKSLYAGKLKRATDMRPGFIITKLNDTPVKSVDKFLQDLENRKGGVMLEGVYEDVPGVYYYAFGM